MLKRSTGKVKWFNDQKAHGFITPDDGGEDLLVTAMDIETATEEGIRTLQEGQKVSYVAQKTPHGYSAKGVQEIE